MLLFWKQIHKTQMSNPPEAASYRNSTKLLIFLPLRAIYFYSLYYETPCTTYIVQFLACGQSKRKNSKKIIQKHLCTTFLKLKLFLVNQFIKKLTRYQYHGVQLSYWGVSNLKQWALRVAATVFWSRIIKAKSTLWLPRFFFPLFAASHSSFFCKASNWRLKSCCVNGLSFIFSMVGFAGL